jgi:ribosomal protein S8E
VAFQGYYFTSWQDGNTDNPRTVTVTGNATYTAMFKENSVVTHTVTLICNTEEGSVMGGGVYVHGSQATIQAIPNQGYTFSKWSDDSTENPRTITVNSDMTLVAFFGTGVDENELANVKVYPNPAKWTIRIAGIEANSEAKIYNSLGALVKVVNVSADDEISIRDLSSGLYLIRCGNTTLRFVKQ